MLWTPEHGLRPSSAQTELIHTIRRCGLTSGLKLCLDAGDANSYASGQSWLDTSGNGYDFFRGEDVSTSAADPTYNGTAGQRASTNYWSFDGGDYFRYDAANEAWMNNLHKDNAKFTLIAGIQIGTLGVVASLFGNNGAILNATGITWRILSSNNNDSVIVGNAGVTVLTAPSGTAIPSGVPLFLAVSLDESTGANGGFFYRNGSVVFFTSTYTAPSSGSANNTSEIMARGAGVGPISNTSRLWFFAAWEGVALTQEQLNALYMGTRGRFGV